MSLSNFARVFCVCALVAAGAAPVRASSAAPPSVQQASTGAGRTLVVLVPGFGGRAAFPLGGRYFMELDEALTSAGFDVVTLAPPPVATSEARGAWLADAIAHSVPEAPAPRPRVVVIAHSQGGVDARAALDQGAPIDAIATLSTPHHGTDVAEVALAWPRPLVRAALHEMNRGAPTWGDAEVADVALAGLTRDGMDAFNARHPTSRVPFFSVAAFSGADVDDACAGGRWSKPRDVDAIHPMLLAGRAMIRWQRDVSDDGVVPTNSMRFGTFLGCVAADHVDWQRWDVELDDARFNSGAFILELARGLDDVARDHDARAMDVHVAKLAALAQAHPLD